MRFEVDCFENQQAFSGPLWETAAQFEFALSYMRRVQVLTVEANTADGAAQAAWEIANAPWNPTDLNGIAWRHDTVRSMSSGDVVVVYTPDGPVAYGCAFMGWVALPPSILPDGAVTVYNRG